MKTTATLLVLLVAAALVLPTAAAGPTDLLKKTKAGAFAYYCVGNGTTQAIECVVVGIGGQIVRCVVEENTWDLAVQCSLDKLPPLA